MTGQAGRGEVDRIRSSEFGIRNCGPDGRSERVTDGERGGAALKAVAWVLVGAVVMLFLVVDPFGVSPVDGWLGIERSAVIGHGDGDGRGEETELWTCPMHPQILEKKPGTCPICGMDLVPVKKEAGHGDGDGKGDGKGEQQILFYRSPMDPNVTSPVPRKDEMGMDYIPVFADEAEAAAAGGAVVTIDPAVQQNMNVVTRRVERRDISHEIRTVGYLDYDQERMVSVTTKYPGFIEKTYVNYIGQPVTKGEPLFEIYAPELIQTEQELLAALRYSRKLESAPSDTRDRARALVEAARQRLAYWDVSPAQVRSLEETGEVFRTLQVLAPASGVVMLRIPGLEGMATQPGTELLHIVDLSNLWLTVEVFDSQLPWLDVGSSATISLSYFPGVTYRGRVRYVEPEVSEKTRTVRLTLDVPNRDGRLRVGMYATVVFKPVVATDALTVPADAVIRTGERNLVVVAIGNGRFAPRTVVLGPGGEGFVEVLEGLGDGDEVVTSAQFLIDSESNLREAIQMMVSEKREGGGE
jgi:Cu(I)/Ag(I) efflux system membrane fusion protein